MTSKIYKFSSALIGAGRIGFQHEYDEKRIKPASHYGMLIGNKKINFKAICDTNSKNLELIKKNNKNINFYESYKEMIIKEKPDIVSIATWRDTHYEIMDYCSDKGVKAIICEKPISENLKDAKKIVSKLKNLNIPLFINHRRRFDSELIKLKTNNITHYVGEILQVNCFYVYGLLTTGTHLIDTLIYLLEKTEGEIKSVLGFSNTSNSFCPTDDPNIDFILFFSSGLKVFVQSLDMKSYDIFEFNFFGKKGKLSLKNIGRDIDQFNIIKSPEHKGFTELNYYPKKKLGGKPRNQFGMLINNVIETLNGKSISYSNGDDSIKVMKIIEAIKLSTLKNKKINL